MCNDTSALDFGHGITREEPPCASWSLGILLVTGHGIAKIKDLALKLHKVAGDYDEIVYETFRLRADKAQSFVGHDFPTIQLIGMIRQSAWIAGTKLVSHDPVVKTTATRYVAAHQPAIQALLDNMPSRHDEAHDGDALLHLAHRYFTRFA